MRSLVSYEKWVIRLMPVFYAVGLAGHALESTYPFMIALTPYTILATAVLGLLPFVVNGHVRLLFWAAVTYGVTLFLEILGVKTGLVFGSYVYGSTLGLELLGVPLLIGINWTIIILGSITLVKRWVSSPLAVMFITAVITVVFDYIMEPAAIALDYWSWDGGGIPVQNYIAWGVISFMCAGLYEGMKLNNPYRLPTVIVLVQGVFFLALRFIVV